MDNKKKLSSIFLSILFVMFFGITLGNSCKAVSLDDYQLTNEIMEDIVQEVGLDFYYSGDYIPLLTNNFNTMMRTVRARGDGHLVTLRDCVFAGQYTSTLSATSLQVVFINWRDNSPDRAFYENNYQPYYNLYSQQQAGGTLNGQLTLYNWLGWNYDANNTINGVSTGYLPHWLISQTGSTYTSSSNMTIYRPTFTRINSGDIAIDKMLILDDNSIDGEGYVMFASRTYQWGYGFYIYSNVLYLDNYGTTPTPTPTPTSTPGGGGSTDLTQTNTLISDINSSINDVASSGDFIFNSGDYLSAIGFQTVLDPSDNFWDFLIEGLRLCLLNDIRYLEMDVLGQTYILDNQAYNIQNAELSFLVTAACTIGFIILEFKFIHHIIVLVSTFDLGDILLNVRHMDISDFF